MMTLERIARPVERLNVRLLVRSAVAEGKTPQEYAAGLARRWSGSPEDLERFTALAERVREASAR